MDEKTLKALAIGALAAVAILYFGPAVATSARPLLRRGIKAAVKGYVQSQETIAELQELAEDAIAEAWAELKSEAEAAASASPAAASGAVMAAAPKSAPKETASGPKKRKRRQPA
jgi:hypothetical protein